MTTVLGMSPISDGIPALAKLRSTPSPAPAPTLPPAPAPAKTMVDQVRAIRRSVDTR